MRHFSLCLTASLTFIAIQAGLGCSGTSPGDGSGGSGASTNVGTGGTGTTGSGGAGSGATTGSGATGSGATGSGATGSGAASGDGGTGGSDGVPPSDCTEADLEACDNGIGTHCGYTYEYWKDSGSGCLENTADGFSVEWSGINNLLGRKGIRPGTAQNVITYEADYNPNGNSYLCAYGWTTDPLVEYYIVDSWGSWKPPGGGGDENKMGTVTSDGGTYDIYRTQRVQQPSIEGTQTFYQYWSVRTEKRESGTITVGNHFAAWEDAEMEMGDLYEVSLCVEGYQSSGNADVTMHIE